MAWRRTGDKPLSDTMLVRFTDAYMWHQGKISWLWPAGPHHRTFHNHRFNNCTSNACGMKYNMPQAFIWNNLPNNILTQLGSHIYSSVKARSVPWGTFLSSEQMWSVWPQCISCILWAWPVCLCPHPSPYYKWYQHHQQYSGDHLTILDDYTPAQRSWRGGILDSPCPSVCPSVCL